MNEQYDNISQTTEEQASILENSKNNPPKAKNCSNCNHLLTEEQKFCPHCGTPIEIVSPMPSTCQTCGCEVSPETKFCPQCGTQIVLPTIKVSKKAKFNKKRLFLIAGISAAVLAIVTAIILILVFREIPVEYITLSEDSIVLKEEEMLTVSCTVYPSNADNAKVTWTSSDKSVAKVSSYGRITAVGKGTCTITATVGEESETIFVTVKRNNDFKTLYDDFCKSTWASLGSDYSYLSVDTNPYDHEDGDYRYFTVVNDAIEKIHNALGLPDSLYEDMTHTTWSMGKQSETFKDAGVLVTWTYHPDKGLEVTYKLIND